MRMRVARKVFANWGTPVSAIRLGSFLRAKRLSDRRFRRSLQALRVAGGLRIAAALWHAYDLGHAGRLGGALDA